MTEEYRAIRYALMIQSGSILTKVEGYKKLLELCKKMNWIV